VGLTVAKVGGSLFDMPHLRDRLRHWCGSVVGPVLLIPGGGSGADFIRHLDRTHGLGDEAAHWLALRMLSVNAHLLAGLLGVPVMSELPIELTSPERKRRANDLPSLTLRAGQPALFGVIDPHAFCVADNERPGALPHTWDVTSDSIAARVAEVAGAELVLLKSADLAAGMSWQSAAADGLVDPTFDSIVRRSGLRVTWVNLRRSLP
jgi:5-(aminomethyl)-3-furanmethanol phosphate kinase